MREDSGAVAIMTALLMVVFMGFAAIAVDIARQYAAAAELQKAADAGALAGAVYLPGDFAQASSVANATVLANLRGAKPGDVTINVSLGARPTQLRVSVSQSIDFIFGAAIGVASGGVVRAATAEFAGPIPMGSPCNVFGNENMEAAGSKVASSNCSANAGTYWLNVSGPAVNKARGDDYAASWCGAPDDGTYRTIDGCTAVNAPAPGTNSDYLSNVDSTGKAKGYVYVYRVHTGGLVDPQVYDGSWVFTGDQCGNMRDASAATNSFVPTAAEAAQRYKPGSSAYCSGDSLQTDNPQNGNGTKPVTTRFTVRGPIDSSGDPLNAPVVCQRTFTGWDGSDANFASWLTEKVGGKANPAYIPDLAESFHRWANICPQGGFSAASSSDYSLQIETTINGVTQGAGQNRMALRATIDSGNTNVSIFGAGKFSMFYNTPLGKSTFNLVRLGSGAAGKTLKIGFFDFGDVGNSVVDVTLNKPDSSNLGSGGVGNPLDSCTASKDSVTASGVVTGALSSCTVPGITSNVYGGHYVYVSVPVPKSYLCNADTTKDPQADSKCWITVTIDVRQSGTGTPSSADTTTINAGLSGDPVRLIS